MTLSQWADVAVVFLSIQAFILMLVPLVLFYFLIRGMNMAGGAMPGYMKRAQSFTRMVRDRTRGVSDKIAEPILKAHVKTMQAEATIQSFSTEVSDSFHGPEKPIRPGETETGGEMGVTIRDAK